MDHYEDTSSKNEIDTSVGRCEMWDMRCEI